MKTLVIFDFDDTLFRSNSMIGIQPIDGQKRYISTHEYASYVPKHGEKFDYHMFDEYPVDPKPVRAATKKFDASVRDHGIHNVVILTARSNPEPVRRVLSDFGMPPVKILAIGSANPHHKADEVEKLMAQDSFSRVVVYEDNKKNIDAIRHRIHTTFPASHFSSFLVKATKRGDRLMPEGIRAALQASELVSHL